MKGVELEIKEEDKKYIFENFTKSINEKLDTELLKTIEEKYSPSIIKSNQFSKLLEDISRVINRLQFEIRKLSARANLNLVIGTLTTIVAAVSLGYVVFESKYDFTNSLQLIAHYLPRLSLIVFIEIFAYFFLKLYKSNLEDIKYYQNELTNIESKFISLKSAFMSEKDEAIKTILEELGKTERNFVLKQGESTVELEKYKFENKNIAETINLLNNLIKKK